MRQRMGARGRMLVALAVVCAGSMVFAAGAFADAGNPILDTMTPTIQDPGLGGAGTVTIYVKGQWDWISHGSDCNVDRAATGVGIMWDDRNGAGATNEVQTISLTGTVTGGTFKLKFDGKTTAMTIAYNATAATVDAALESLSNIGAGGVNVTGGPGPATAWVVEFTGALAGKNVPLMQVANKALTGTGTNVAFATTTEGSAATPSNGWPLTGDTVTGATITAFIGTRNATLAGTFTNPVDRMVHPVDRGNKAEGYNGPAGQAFFDPDPPSTTATASWKGGCGRLPLNQTASPASPPQTTAQNPTGRSCAATPGNTLCAGKPWGSWGYEKNGGLGYAHTYLKSLLPRQVCVNFYDVHGANQVPKDTDEITVDLAGDNSLLTNKFDISEGRNCITIFTPAIVTTASADVTVGGNISDSAVLSGVSSNAGGTLTFRAYKRPANATQPDCTGTPVFTSTPAITVNGPGTYGSGTFNSASPGAGAGLYDWQVTYSGQGLNLPVTTVCGDSSGGNDETTEVLKKLPVVITDARVLGSAVARLGAGGNDLSDIATISGLVSPDGTGEIEFKLYRGADCSAANYITTVGIKNGVKVTGNGNYESTAVPVSVVGQYRWIANFLGDSNNSATNNGCNHVAVGDTETHENLRLINPSISIDKSPDGQVIRGPGTVTFTILVKNTGDSPLTNVTVTDALAPGCARPSATPPPGNLGTLAANDGQPGGPDEVSYQCTKASVDVSFTNSATATGTPEAGANVTATDVAPVTVIHPAIRVFKDPDQQSVVIGGTAHWTITVKNTGDVELDNVTVDDVLGPDCARPRVNPPLPNLGTLAKNDNAPGGPDETSYTCEKTNVQAAFNNVVTACGAPDPDQPGGQPVCDTDPGTLEDRDGDVGVLTLTTKQDFKPTDKATIAGLIGANPGGTITFELYKEPGAGKTCGGTPIYTNTQTVTANGVYTAASPDLLSTLIGSTQTAGNYNWKVSYSGNAATFNGPIPGACGAENFQIDNG